LEFENEHADLQRRWDAYHAGGGDLQSLVDARRNLERALGCAPGTLLNEFQKAKGE
jgi:hypothetical protein